jgi:hypothetical protein
VKRKKKKEKKKAMLSGFTCNSSYWGGRKSEDYSSLPVQA